MLANSDHIVAATNDILDSTGQAISSGAFQRHGEIVTAVEHNVSFNIHITTIDTESRYITTNSSECPICNDDEIKTFEDLVLEAPFDTTNSYARLQDATHQKNPCINCESTGEVMCNKCHGHGKLECGECNSTGRICAEDCPSCGGSSSSAFECLDSEDGDTTIVECSNCNGKGEVVCTDCSGDRNVNCPECVGDGKLHTYYKLEYNTKREIKASELPSFWGSSAVDIATQFDWDSEDLQVITSSSRAVEIETVEHHVGFVSLKYGGERYNVALFLDESDLEGIWDPETGYPETSVRNTLTDWTSRIVGK